VQWRPGVTLDLPRLKEAVLRWRGAVRYGGAVVTVVGVVDEPVGSGAAPASLPLRAVGTGQRFRLQAKEVSSDLSLLPRGEPVRVTGRVTREKEGKENEIWLEWEREPSAK
jgi:hypothetical protein